MHRDPNIFLANILVIDKDPANHHAVQSTLEEGGFERVRKIYDPFEAVSHSKEEPPDLLLLNLHDQPLNRFELFVMLRAQPISDGFLPVLVMLAPEDGIDKKEQADLGAYDFVDKPVNPTELMLRVQNSLQARWLDRRLHKVADELEVKVAERTKDLYKDQIEILGRLARASEYRDDDTGDHTRRVGAMSAKIAVTMGLPEDQIELIRLAAPLHDIGKIGIRDAILMKPGKLTETEFVVMRTHATIGSKILEGRSPLLQMAEIIARTHHEKWDGTGYPGRLAGEAIPLPGRIVAVADVFDALISARSYKTAWPVSKAINEIASLSGRHFDPLVVEAFLNVISRDSEIPKAA